MKQYNPIYNFTLTIHLAYNVYDLRNQADYDSEERYELEQPIAWKEQVPYGIVNFNISNVFRADVLNGYNEQKDGEVEEQSNKDRTPERFFLLTVTGIQAHTADEAWGVINFDSICKALTLLLNKVDIANKDAYQPRVIPDYSTAKADSDEVQEAIERKEDDGVISFELNEAIHMRESFYCIATCTVKDATDNFKKYYYQPSYRSAYVMDQLYMALGNEKMSSKFFHLAAIIEFVEREYDNLSGSRYLFPGKAERKAVTDAVTKAIDGLDFLKSVKQAYIRNACGRNLSEMTNLGRNLKLKNILHNMGIESFKGPQNKEIIVDTDYCEKITNLRNKYFHASDTVDGKKTEIKDVVAELICLCMRIADYAEETDIQASIRNKVYQSIDDFAERCGVGSKTVKNWIRNKYIPYREVIIDKKKEFDIANAAKKPYTQASRITSSSSIRETIMKATYLGYHITPGMFSKLEVTREEFEGIIKGLIDEGYIEEYMYDSLKMYLPTKKLEEWGKEQGLEDRVLQKFKEQAMKQAEEYKNWVPSEDDEKYRIRYIEAE